MNSEEPRKPFYILLSREKFVSPVLVFLMLSAQLKDNMQCTLWAGTILHPSRLLKSISIEFYSIYFFPFVGYSYRVVVTLDGPSWPNLGFMYVAFVGDNDSTKEYQLYV